MCGNTRIVISNVEPVAIRRGPRDKRERDGGRGGR